LFRRLRHYISNMRRGVRVPSFDHARVQSRLGFRFELLRENGKALFPAPQCRISAKDREAMPDISVFTERSQAGRPPEGAPLVVIEIVSPDDYYGDVLARLREYSGWGVRHVWVVDLHSRRLSVFASQSLAETDRFRLPEHGIEITQEQIFD
jgi:Uma2 family endonuclease